MNKKIVLPLLFVLALSLSACGKDKEEEVPQTVVEETADTSTQTVEVGEVKDEAPKEEGFDTSIYEPISSKEALEKALSDITKDSNNESNADGFNYLYDDGYYELVYNNGWKETIYDKEGNTLHSWAYFDKTVYEELASYEELDSRVIDIIRDYDTAIESDEEYHYFLDEGYFDVSSDGGKIYVQNEYSERIGELSYKTDYYNEERDLGTKVEEYEKLGYQYTLYDRNIVNKDNEVIHTNHYASVSVIDKGLDVPESVERDGVTYEVIALTKINGDGEFSVPQHIKYLPTSSYRGNGGIVETNVFRETDYSKVIIPDTVIFAELHSLFQDSENLEEVEIAESVYKPYILRHNHILETFYNTGIKSYVIPDGVESINMLFGMCQNLVSVTLPDSIQEADFGTCPNLSELNYSDNLDLKNVDISHTAIKHFNITSATTAVDGRNFWNTSKLRYLVFPDNVKLTEISDVFSLDAMPELRLLRYPEEKTDKISNISGCNNLEVLILPDELDEISDGAINDFKDYSNLTIYASEDICKYYSNKYPELHFEVKGSKEEMDKFVEEYTKKIDEELDALEEGTDSDYRISMFLDLTEGIRDTDEFDYNKNGQVFTMKAKDYSKNDIYAEFYYENRHWRITVSNDYGWSKSGYFDDNFLFHPDDKGGAEE